MNHFKSMNSYDAGTGRRVATSPGHELDRFDTNHSVDSEVVVV